jgi:VanZ family protein
MDPVRDPSREEKKLRFSRLYWVAGWALVALVVWGSLRPESQVVRGWWPPDKIVHFSAYCTMAFWFAGMTERRRYPYLAIVLLILGGLVEIGQGAMGYGRDADWRDFLANAMGIATALILAYAGLGTWMLKIERKLGLS